RLGRLQQALWDRDSKAIVDALSPSERDLATNRSFIAKFVEVAPARARYGIRWFEFFDLMRVRAPWILLAAGTELQGDSHRLWVTDYVEGTRCFSWLRLRRSGVQALAHLT